MSSQRLFKTAFSAIYPLYLNKLQRKGRTQQELDQVITWLTGHSAEALRQRLQDGSDLQSFFEQAPAPNPNSGLITGLVCGVRVEDVQDPLMRKIRCLDKLVDELAKGKAMEKVLRR